MIKKVFVSSKFNKSSKCDTPHFGAFFINFSLCPFFRYEIVSFCSFLQVITSINKVRRACHFGPKIFLSGKFVLFCSLNVIYVSYEIIKIKCFRRYSKLKKIVEKKFSEFSVGDDIFKKNQHLTKTAENREVESFLTIGHFVKQRPDECCMKFSCIELLCGGKKFIKHRKFRH